jgi:hypothetical protein
MQWVPAHCGLEGNELADQLAKAGCTLPQQDVEIPLAVARTVIHRHVTASWQNSVRDEMNSWHIDACGGRRKWPIPPDLEGLHRRDCVTIHQLRTGTSSLLHNYLARLPGAAESDLCPNCTMVSDSAQHFLTGCDALLVQRRDCFGTDGVTAGVAFENSQDLLQFVRRSGRRRPRL